MAETIAREPEPATVWLVMATKQGATYAWVCVDAEDAIHIQNKVRDEYPVVSVGITKTRVLRHKDVDAMKQPMKEAK